MDKIVANGKSITIRGITGSDYGRPKKLLAFINELVDDPEAMILARSHQTLTDEKVWVRSTVNRIKNNKAIFIIAEADGQVVGTAHVELRRERCDHVAEFGIAILKNHRGIGLGSLLMERVLGAIKTDLRPCPRIVRLSVFDGNDRAIRLYEHFGFVRVAVIPRQFQFKDRLVDEIVMIREV